MRRSTFRGRLFWASVVLFFAGSLPCLADAVRPMNLSVSLTPSTQSVTFLNGLMSETFIVEASLTWTAPTSDVGYYRIWVDGAHAGLISPARTSCTIEIVREVRLFSPQDESAWYEQIIGAYLGASHQFTLTAERYSGGITDTCVYLPPNVLRIGYSVTGVPEGLPQPLDIVHEQQSLEGFDERDGKALYGMSAGAARIASVVPIQKSGSLKLSRDARPHESTSDVIVQLNLISATGAPMIFAAPTHNELRLSIPTAQYNNIFDNLPLTISLHDPCDPNRVFPSYDIRQVIAKYAGVLKLPDLEGSYDVNTPVAFLKVSFTKEATADPNGGMQTGVIMPDPNAPTTIPVDPNAIPVTETTDPNQSQIPVLPAQRFDE
jgi:hypothetical protein